MATPSFVDEKKKYYWWELMHVVVYPGCFAMLQLNTELVGDVDWTRLVMACLCISLLEYMDLDVSN